MLLFEASMCGLNLAKGVRAARFHLQMHDEGKHARPLQAYDDWKVHPLWQTVSKCCDLRHAFSALKKPDD